MYGYYNVHRLVNFNISVSRLNTIFRKFLDNRKSDTIYVYNLVGIVSYIIGTTKALKLYNTRGRRANNNSIIIQPEI